MPHESQDEHPRPSMAADVVVMRFRRQLEVLLIERGRAPYQGAWALPGGFVEPHEAPRAAAARELLEETGVERAELHEIGVFGDPGRDPRGWIVSSAWIGLVQPETEAHAGDDAARAAWFPLSELPPLAFDHDQILGAARSCLRRLTQTSPAPLALLGAPFRTARARALYSEIWQRRLPPRAFKAWLRRRNVVRRVGPARFAQGEALTVDWLR